MKEILKYLNKNSFYISKSDLINDKNENITHIYTKKYKISYCIIAPHSGNNFKYLLRINPTQTLDRWGVCDIQKEFDKPISLIKYLKNNEIEIYQELLDIYMKFYIDSLEE